MFKPNKLALISVLSIFIFLNSFLFVNGQILKNSKKVELEQNINTISASSGFSQVDTLETIIARVIRVLLISLGTIFMALMFLAGQAWMRASGNDEIIRQSKDKIISLLIGLIIILAAYALSAWISKVLANLIEL